MTRWEILRKSGDGAEVEALLREGLEKLPVPHARRIYKPRFAEHGQYVVETEWESLEEQKEWNAQTGATLPEGFFDGWADRLNAGTRAGGSTKVWVLLD